MKKSLILLPLLAGTMLSGCYVDLGFMSFGKAPASNGTGTGNGGTGTGTGGGSQTGGGGGGSTISVDGTPFATVTMKGCQDAVDKNARPLVFTNGGASVIIGQSTATTDMAQAITNTKTYEFRVYKGMSMTFEANKSFSKLLITFSTWAEKDGTTYYFDGEIEGATNQYDTGTGKALLTLDSAATSFSAGDAHHQIRIDNVAFYA